MNEKSKTYLCIFIPFTISLITVFLPSLTVISPVPLVLGLPLLIVADLGFFTMLLALIVLNFIVFFILNYDLIKGKGYDSTEYSLLYQFLAICNGFSGFLTYHDINFH